MARKKLAPKGGGEAACLHGIADSESAIMKKRSASCIDQQGTIVDPLDLVPVFVLEHQKIVGGVKSIESTVRGVIQTEQDTRMCWELNEEGKVILETGS
ncbi:hypothetical protein quinque_002493 [Culex quinquefasciatus]